MNHYFSLSTNPLTNQGCMLSTTRMGGSITSRAPAKATFHLGTSSICGINSCKPMTAVVMSGSVVISSGQRYWFQPYTNSITTRAAMLVLERGRRILRKNIMVEAPSRVSAGLMMVFEGGLRLPLPDRAGKQVRPDMDVIMGLRTEDITVVNGHEGFPSEWKAEGIVEVVEPLGSETNLHLDLSGTKLVARCEGGRSIKAGDHVPLALNLNHLHIFDAASKQSIY